MPDARWQADDDFDEDEHLYGNVLDDDGNMATPSSAYGNFDIILTRHCGPSGGSVCVMWWDVMWWWCVCVLGEGEGGMCRTATSTSF